MKLLYGVGFSEEDRRNFVPMVHNNILSSIKVLIENMRLLGYSEENTEVRKAKNEHLISILI